jgi:hypothetical protein
MPTSEISSIPTPQHPNTLTPPSPAGILSRTGAHSSVGQSARFTSVRSQVQVLLRPPLGGYQLSAIGYQLLAVGFGSLTTHDLRLTTRHLAVYFPTPDVRLPPPFQVPFRVTRPGRRAGSHAPEPRGLTRPGPMRTIAQRPTRPAPGPLAAARQKTFARHCGGSESDQVGGRNGAGTDAGR